jgi:general secretion pathway protein B
VSLILDALRKADAERERGSVPSLHSQPLAATAPSAPRKPPARPGWLWVAIGVTIGLAGAATWVMVGSDAPPPNAAARPERSPPGIPEAGPAAAVPVTPSPAAVAPAAGATSPPAALARGDAQPIAEPAPWRPPDERKDARAEAKVGAPAPVAATPAAADTPVYTREQLPPNIRSELPQFAVGGSIYSSNPAARSLIVNGQLYREKDRLTQDLSLEEIKLKAAVFSFRGYRFEVLF